MNESTKVFITSILITGLVALLTTAGSILFLYHTAVEEQKERLFEFVTNQAQFIALANEVSLEHEDLPHEGDVEKDPHSMCNHNLASILSKFTELSSEQKVRSLDKSRILNFYVAEKQGENVKYYMGTQKLLNRMTPYEKLSGKPMGMALEGGAGVLQIKDHLGNPTLCAFTYVESIGLGIVAKIFLADLRRPFVKTAIVTYIVAFILVLCSGFIIKKTVSPLVTKLEQQRRQLEEKNEILIKQATTDALTKVYNRQYFNQYLEHGISSAERYNNSFSLIMLDVDHFKEINDAFGHLAGDTVLKEISALINTHIRNSDILSRWGGEEFAILILETDLAVASTVAKNLCQLVAQHRFSVKRQVTCSFGVTSYKPGETITEFIGRADNGLYQAKKGGRNQVVVR